MNCHLIIACVFISQHLSVGQDALDVHDDAVALLALDDRNWLPNCPELCEKFISTVGNIIDQTACDDTVPKQQELCRSWVGSTNTALVKACEYALYGGCHFVVGRASAFTERTCKTWVCREPDLCALAAPQQTAVKCKDIEWNENVWGKSAKGVNLQSYIPMMPFIGCVGDGCVVDDFYCIDDANSIEFGVLTTTRVMRAAIGPAMPTSYISCCSATYPNHVCNAPDDQVSANEICNKLGYSYAQFGKGTDNACPEPHFDGVRWTSDWVMSAGSAQYYHCYN